MIAVIYSDWNSLIDIIVWDKKLRWNLIIIIKVNG